MPAQADIDLYPLRLSPLAVEKVWGGHKLSRLFPQDVPAGRPIGEVWAIWDQLPVDNGPLRGKQLAGVVRDHPVQTLGSNALRLAPNPAKQEPLFPLLVKFLDARDTLSVQVHPGDDYARAQEGEPFGKAEAWYILEADPGACLIHGVRVPLTREEAETAIQAGTLQELMNYEQVSAGDLFMNPPGTIHALLEGLLLYEIQQSSDLTYRLYDWDRRDPRRPLHIDKSLDVAGLQPLEQHKVNPIAQEEPGCTRTLLLACRYFAVEMLQVQSQIDELPAGVSFHLLTVLEGSGSVLYGPSQTQALSLKKGDSILVPAGLLQYRVQTLQPPFTLVKAWVPNLVEDIVSPLREKGVPDREIAQLGGDLATSDLATYVRS